MASDVPGAFAAAAAALRALPQDADARDACVRFAGAAGRFEELYEILDEAAGCCDGHGEDEHALRAAAADVAEQQLAEPAEAAHQLERCLVLAPADRAAMASLTRVLMTLERWDAACELLERRSASAEGAERIALLAQLGDILQDRLLVPDRAALVYRRALHGAGPEARRRVLRSLAGALAATGDHVAEAAALEDLARCSDDVAETAEASRRRELLLASPTGAPPSAVERLRDMLAADAGDDEVLGALESLAASPHERLGDPDDATGAWGELLRLVPGDRDALAAVVRLHRRAGRGREQVEACLALADASESEGELLQAWREAAEVLEHALDDPARAVEIWRRVAALSPDDAAARDALERLLLRLDRPAELAEILAWRRGRPGGEDDPELAFRLAELHRTRLGAPGDALLLLRTVLCRDPHHPGGRAALIELAASPGDAGREALVILDGLFREEGAHAERARARERRLAAVVEPDERLRLHGEIRSILEHDLGQRELAFAAAARALAEGGAVAADACPELERLAAAAGLLEELADVYEAAASGAASEEEALSLRRRAAQVRSRDGEDLQAATGAWSRVLEAAPDDDEALSALEQLHARAGEPARLAEVARRRAALAQGGARTEILLTAATSLRSLGDAGGAVRVAEEALAADPGSAPALAFLAGVHREVGDRAGLARVLRAQADLSRGDPLARHAVLLDLARLLEDAGDGRGALEVYAEILADERLQRGALDGLDRLLARPETRDAASRMLEGVYRAQGDARRLAAVLEARVEGADAAERVRLLSEIAALRERLGERLEAFRVLVRAAREAGRGGADEMPLAHDLERLAAGAGAYDELAAAYEEALARGLPAPARNEIRRRLAGLYADRLDRPDLATRTLEALAGEAPAPEVLAALARMYRRQGAHRELAGVLRRQAEIAPSIEARKDLLFEVSTIMEERLSAREGAMEAYRQILSVDPEDPNALRLLGNLLNAAERWDELVEVLGREVDVAEGRPNLGAEAAELRFRLGRIRHQRLADTAGALQCYRGVLERVPRHPAALAALEEMATGGGAAAVEAAILLEPVYEQEAEHAKLVQALEVRVAAAGDATARSALLERVAQVQAAGLRSPELAFLTVARAIREDPDRAESMALAERFAEAAGLHDELAALLTEVADRLHDPRAGLELRRRIAHLTARGGDPRRDAEAWTRVLDLAPEDPEALSAITDAHRAAGDADALAQILRRRSSLAEDPSSRASILAELAEVQERQQDHAGAMATLRRLVDADPARRDALASLDRLCVEGERWVELADVLGREVAGADAAGDRAAALGLRQRLAELKETRLLDREGAIALYEQILSARADDAQALSRLEAMLQRDPGNGRAAALLERAYAASGAWARYAAVIELRAAERPDPVERKALFLELAEIQERRLGSAELAFIALCRAFRDDPSDPAVRADMQRLATATGQAEELAAIFEDEFEKLPAAVAAEVGVTLGSLHEEQLGDPGAAIGWLERARLLDPAVAARALTALDRLHRARGDHAGLADVLEAEAGISAGEERASFLFRLGQHCEEQLRDTARAARAYQALVAEQPAHGAALRALERIYDGEGQVDALAENLAAQRALVADAPSRLRLTVRLAGATQAMGNDEEAVALWREALALDPRHEPALAALERLHEGLQRWPDLAEHLGARLAATADRRESARIHEKLAGVFATKLGDLDQAIRAYHGVLDADPRHRGALEALRDIHEKQGDLDALAAVHRRLVPLQENAAGVRAVRTQLAEVLLQAGKKGEAAEQGRRALDLDPSDEAELSRLARLLDAAGAPQDAVRAVEARAALLTSAGRSGEAVEAWLAAADTWQRQLGKPEAACVALEKALELEPANRGAWSQLRELYASLGNWRAYAHVCDLFTAHMPDRAERLATLREVGEIHERRLGQKEMAFISLCRAFVEEPADEAVATAVHRLAGETQAWEELAAVYEQLAHDAVGVPKARLLLDLGRLRDARLDDAGGAEAAFRRALEVDPASAEALDALTDLFTRRGRVRDLVIALEQKLEAAAGLNEKKATLMEMTRIYEGQLQDPGEAIASLKRVLELDGCDAAALDLLAGLYRRQARWGDLAGTLARKRDLAADDATRLGCQLQIAALHENELADEEAAVDAYRAALAIDDCQRDALSGLERLYTRLDRFAELNGICERQVELATDPREKVGVLLKSAAIWEEKLHDPARAIERNEAVLALDPANLGAVKSLEALYRRAGQPEKLIAVLQQHAGLTRDPREIVSLEVQIGEVWWKELGSTDRAESTLTHALQLDPGSREAVSALARLHEQGGRWTLALEMLRREAELAGAGREVVELQSRIARIEEEELEDRAAAKIAYAHALEADPGHLPSLRALRAIAQGEGDRDAYLKLLLSEARYVEDDRARAALLHEAGRIHQEERLDPDGAARLYEEALGKVSDFLPAARPLADLYVMRGEWRRAEAVLDVVVRRLAEESETQDLCRQSYRLGYVAEKLRNEAKALEWYRRAYELDSTYLPALEGLGALLVRAHAWEEALKIFQAMLIHHRDGLTDLEVVEAYWQIGDLQARLGQPDRAANSFEKALEIDAGHERSRRGVIAVLEAAGDWEAAVEHRRKLLGSLEGGAKRDLYVSIAEICRDRLQDAFQAADAFTAAARIDPGSAEVVEALLALYRETRQGQKAADVLGRLLESPELKGDPQRAARLHHALAVTLRDDLKDEAGAARELERALDADPRHVQALADLEALLGRSKKWRDLEQVYVRMIERLPRTPEFAAARVAVWKALGELYRRVLGDTDRARMAFEVVATANPDDRAAVEAHAELAAKVPGHEAEATAAYRRVLALADDRQAVLSQLVRLHAERRSYDEAYSAAQALAFLAGGASAEEGQVVSRLRRFARDTATGALDDALWEKVLHEKARGPLSSILALLVRDASEIFVQRAKDLGLNPNKDEIDVAASMLFFVNMYKYVARALGFAAPRLFRSVRPEDRLRVVPFQPPALVAGEALFRERPKKELWFTIGKAMTFLRPELMLARLMPHDQLDALFQAAASLGTSRFAVSADPHLVQKLKRRLENVLPEATRTQTLKLLARAYCDVQRPGDVRAYMDAAELTSNRVGALLAGDLDVVRRMIVAEKAAVSKLKEEVRLRDLVLFCTSPEYAAARQQLGVSVVVPTTS